MRATRTTGEALTRRTLPVPSVRTRTRPLEPEALPPILIRKIPTPTLVHPGLPSTSPNRLTDVLPSQATSSSSSPSPFSIRLGSEGIVGAGGSSAASSAGCGVAAARVSSPACAEAESDPKLKLDVATGRLGAAAPKEKLGAPPGRRWNDGGVGGAAETAGDAVGDEPKGVKEKGFDAPVAGAAVCVVEKENGLEDVDEVDVDAAGLSPVVADSETTDLMMELALPP